MNERMRLLIGYDGSECSNAALDDLQLAGLPSNGEVLVVSVTELWLPSPPPSSVELVDSVFRSDASPAMVAQQACNRLQTILPGWQIEGEDHTGSAARQILNKTDEWKPDLIVVGSRGRSGIGGFLLGSVSHKIVTESPCSVRVARGSADSERRSTQPVRIAVGLDGFSDSKAAADQVAHRNWPKGSEVRLITAVGPFFSHEDANERFDFAHFIQDAAKKNLEESGLTVSQVVKEIDPKHLLLSEAETWKADCVFVGTSNLSRVERILLGSISSAVVTRAHCSVEVVRKSFDTD